MLPKQDKITMSLPNQQNLSTEDFESTHQLGTTTACPVNIPNELGFEEVIKNCTAPVSPARALRPIAHPELTQLVSAMFAE